MSRWPCRLHSSSRRFPEVEETVQSDPSAHDVPIPLNQRVLSFVELFQGRLHDFLEEGMKRGSG
jgi:hypothetical protein